MKTRQTIFLFSFSIIIYLLSVKEIFAEDSILVIKGVYIAYDISKPIRYAYQNNIKQQEVSLALYTGKQYNFSCDMGYSNVFFSREYYNIELSGIYFKTGFEKLILNDHKNLLSYGFRLAGANYENIYKNAYINDNIYGNLILNLKSSKLFSIWGEGLLKLDMNIIGNFNFGWSIRIKYPLYFQKDEYFKPYYVPGYGKTIGSVMIGFNYYITYRISIK